MDSTVVTAQKFLSDINKRLASIEQGVSAIRSWLEDETISSIEANLKYMYRMYRTLESFKIMEADYRVFSSQLESIDRESMATTCFIRRTLDRAKDDFLSMPMQGIGLQDHTERAIDALEKCGKYGNALLLSESVRYVSSSLRGALGLSREHAYVILEETRSDIVDDASGLRSFDEEARAHISSLKGSIFAFKETNEECKRRVRSALRNDVKPLLQQADEMIKAIDRVIETTKEQLSNQPVRLLVERKSNGTIRKISKIV